MEWVLLICEEHDMFDEVKHVRMLSVPMDKYPCDKNQCVVFWDIWLRLAIGKHTIVLSPEQIAIREAFCTMRKHATIIDYQNSLCRPTIVVHAIVH